MSSDDFDDIDDIPDDRALFGVDDAKIRYILSRNRKRLTITIDAETDISEMKLYCILTLEHERLERRLGIHDADESVSH
jgi:hypothetical protein